VAIAVFAVASAGANVKADLMFDVATPINGDIPQGTLQAAFADKGAGIVDLTMTSNLTGSSEFIGDWGFNFTLNVSKLKVTLLSSTGTVSSKDTVATAFNGTFNPPSVGNFNLVWAANDHSFGPSSSITYQLTYSGSGTFNSSTFDATSTGSTGGPLYSAAKIQGIPGADSGELGNNSGPTLTTESVAPEPSTLAIAGLGALGFLAYGLRRRVAKLFAVAFNVES